MAVERTELESDDATVAGHGGARAPAVGFGAGTTIGRFTVLEPIGSGGMGIVLAAHDPQLDRRVALKLVRGDTLRAKGRERLLREGQAMARLSHPNVLTVHEAGVVGDDVFLVMELVDGQNLREWLETRRTWREVLDVFVAAGRGLAAAHRAGLVHRDFKPDNVLIDREGRVRVMDFGLVVSDGDTTETSSAGSPLTIDLTHTGAVMGTPIYMSPEQHLGAEVDARTDQWAFCVSLYEALWERAPFAGKHLDELRENVLAGRLREPEGRAPARLRAIVMRGLRREPDARYPSIDALLVELAAVPIRRRRLALGAGGGALVASIALAFLAVRPAGARPCRDSERHLDGVWDDAAREQVRAAFARSTLPYAADASARVIASLDTYTGAWVEAHVETCEATAVHHEQSAQALDLRMACLGRRLGEAGALVRLLEDADATLVERAVLAVAGLTPLRSCDDAEQLAGPEPPPAGADPSAVAAVEADIAEARALHAAGRYQDAAARADRAAEAAGTGGFRALEAEAAYVGATALDGLDDPATAERLFAAATRAMAAGAPEIEADAWSLLAVVDAKDQAELADAERWLAIAGALLTRLGDEHRQTALLGSRAQVRRAQGRYDDALTDWREALAQNERQGDDVLAIAACHYHIGGVLYDLARHEEALVELETARAMYARELGAGHPKVGAAIEVRAFALADLGRIDEAIATQREVLALFEASAPADSITVLETRMNLVSMIYSAGRYDEALPIHQELVAAYEKAFGADHPKLAKPLIGLAATLSAMGRFDEALAVHERVLKINEKAFGPDHPEVATPLSNIGFVYTYLGRADEAIAPLRRAVAILEKALGPDHQRTLDDLSTLGNTLRVVKQYRESREVLERVLARQVKVLGPDHPDVGYSHGALAELLAEMGESAAALAHYDRDIAIREKADPEHPNLAIALLRKGRYLHELGRVDEALALLERAFALAERVTRDPAVIAETHYRLALALWDTGDRARAREHMREAMTVYEAEGIADGKEAAEDWFRRHGGSRR